VTARNPKPRRSKVAPPAEADLVRDLNRQLREGRDASSPGWRSAEWGSTLGAPNERGTGPQHPVRPGPEETGFRGDGESGSGSLVIVRAYDPATDLDQRLSRVYALLSLPATEPSGDDDRL